MVSSIIIDYSLENASASDSGYVELESTERWFSEYLNDAEMEISAEELYVFLDH